MEKSFQDYLTNLQSILDESIEEQNFLDFMLFKLIETADQGMNTEEIIRNFELPVLINSALHRLVNEGLITKTGDQFVFPKKVLGAIPGLKTDEKTDIMKISQIEENEVTQDVDIFGSLDESVQKPMMNQIKEKTELDFMPSESGETRARLREQAFKTSSDTSSKSDDVDMDSLFDDLLGESMEDFVADFSDISIEETKAESGLILPLVELLIDAGYINSEPEADGSAEYKIMQTILENYPISSEDLENTVSIDSLSLMLSNLKADNLVDQTNDYRYTITKKVYKKLKDFIGDSKESNEEMDLDRKIFLQFVEAPRTQFLEACLSLSYIDKLGQDEDDYNKIPEYEVLRLIKENEPVSSDGLKNLVNQTLPVVVSRMLSKLHADGVVTTDMNNNYSITTKLYYYMVKDQLKSSMDEDSFEEYQEKYEK